MPRATRVKRRTGAAIAAEKLRLTMALSNARTATAITSPRRFHHNVEISLFFYFLVIYVLATLWRIDLHPVNYFFLAGAFYAFHLLFAYAVDHLTIETTFVLCSVVSIALVGSYLRLVVSASFALREAALAQLVYLIGFSLAHFWEGFTGLTVTVLAIITLFALMQLTGRVKWSEIFSAPAAKAA